MNQDELKEMRYLVASGYSWKEARYAQEHHLLDCQQAYEGELEQADFEHALDDAENQ